MRADRINYTDEECEIKPKESSQKCKYLLPKLKSYSQNDVTTYANLHQKKEAVNSHYPFTHQKNLSTNIAANKTDSSKMSLIKYKYVSKSPAYFKRQNKSVNSGRLDEYSYHQPVESYLETKMKEFDKKALLDLVNSRVKSVTNSNGKSVIIQHPSEVLGSTTNSRLTKSKINYEKVKASISSQKFTYLNFSNLSSCNIRNLNEGNHYKSSEKLGLKTINSINRQNLGQIKQQEQQQEERKFKTIDQKNIQFYETKYSQFKPNKIENVKNHIKNIKKHPSLKLNFYSFL